MQQWQQLQLSRYRSKEVSIWEATDNSAAIRKILRKTKYVIRKSKNLLTKEPSKNEALFLCK